MVADFHTFALFDIDHGAYGTYTDYDMPPKNMEAGARPKLTSAEGHLDLSYESSAGTATWTASRDDAGELLPYTYDYAAFGRDNDGAAMELRLHLHLPARRCRSARPCTTAGSSPASRTAPTPTSRPAPNDRHAALGRHRGTGRGRSGHIDRQWFPSYAGGGGTGGDPRGQAHEWHTITLDNGVDLSVWRQFDRRIGNALVPFTGITAAYADGTAPSASRTSRSSRPVTCAGPTRFAA